MKNKKEEQLKRSQRHRERGVVAVVGLRVLRGIFSGSIGCRIFCAWIKLMALMILMILLLPLSLSPYLSLLCSYNDCTSVASASSASALMPLLLLLSLPPLQKSINKCIVTERRERERKKHFFNITFLILHP